MPPELAIFDCDGTLADSEASIVSAAQLAFTDHDLPAPDRVAVTRNIGLSMGAFLDSVAPDTEPALREELARSYRSHFARLRGKTGPDPLFAGIVGLLNGLDQAGVLLGVATGKSRRGLVNFLTAHDLLDRFATLQTADDAPGKPHPAMVEQAMEETGAEPGRTVMIGDTTFDIGAAVNAGVRGLGVTWGHHSEASLLAAGAERVFDSPAGLGQFLLK